MRVLVWDVYWGARCSTTQLQEVSVSWKLRLAVKGKLITVGIVSCLRAVEPGQGPSCLSREARAAFTIRLLLPSLEGLLSRGLMHLAKLCPKLRPTGTEGKRIANNF